MVRGGLGSCLCDLRCSGVVWGGLGSFLCVLRMSLAVISYKNEDHKAMRKDYEVDISPNGQTRLIRRKIVAN